MNPDDDDDKKKTDESWKERARKEKEKLSDVPEAAHPELPPASFLGHIEELYLRGMLALGQIRNPKDTEIYIDLDGAKYAIDTIQVLLEKTKGNLTPEEESAVQDVLHNLRLLYVHISRAAASAPPAGGGGPGGKPDGGPPEKPGPKIIL
jgi:hypothetical protein